MSINTHSVEDTLLWVRADLAAYQAEELVYEGEALVARAAGFREWLQSGHYIVEPPEGSVPA